MSARGGPDHSDVSALASLARHQPLRLRRQRELVAQAEGRLGDRAKEVLRLLEHGPGTGPAAAAPVAQPLEAADLEALRHPVEREGGALGRIQSALAKVVPPDLGEVRSYCQRADSGEHPALQAALADVCLALGQPMVPAWISRGDKRVGVRGYEKPEPFLLVGAAHLDPADPACLTEAELRFALAEEVTHLRLGHSRVTSEEVWAGVWSKGLTAVSTTASLLPFLKYLPVDLIGRERTARAVQSLVPGSWLGKVYGADTATMLDAAIPDNLGKLGEAGANVLGSGSEAATKVGSWSSLVRSGSGDAPEDLGTDAARLVAAHRVMQITGDRAGLLLAGSLDAAFRAIFKTNSRLARELPVVERAGLAAALARRDAEGRLQFPHLAVRLAALVAFWLSEDFALLQDRLRGDKPLPAPSQAVTEAPRGAEAAEE